MRNTYAGARSSATRTSRSNREGTTHMDTLLKEESRAVTGRVRFDPALLERVSRRVAADIEAERYDGARLMAAHRGQIVLDVTAGFADRAARKPMQKDSAFSIMSIS